MDEATVDQIVKLAPLVEPLIVEAAKGLMSLFERLFPPNSGPKKAAAVVQATQTVAVQTGAAVPTDEQIQGIIAAELPGVLAEMANPPAVVPVETANQMVAAATAGMVPASTVAETTQQAVTAATAEHVETIKSLKTQVARLMQPAPASTTSGVTFHGSTPVLNQR